MRESRTSGSVGALGEQSLGATRPATITGAITSTSTSFDSSHLLSV